MLNFKLPVTIHPVSFIGTIVNIKIFNWISIKLGVIYIFAINNFQFHLWESLHSYLVAMATYFYKKQKEGIKRNKHSKFFLPSWCVFYVRQAIKTAARDLVLHGIVSQSNRPSIINGVRFYDCCSNINCRLSRSKNASNINSTWILTDFPQ